jgi:Zn-dependent protease
VLGFEGDDWLARRLLFLVPVVLSLTVHEFAHAWTAWKLGDDTAAREGRLTLNPLPHIDPIGLLLPLMGVPFGWAKPVPINPARFSRSISMETGLVLTAAAGPLSNALVAVLATVVMALWARLAPGSALDGGLFGLLESLVFLNLLLAVFNLVPIPPLDGSRIADGLMPNALRPAWDAFSRIGPVALVALLFAPAFFGVSVFAWPLETARGFLDELFLLLSG